MRVFITCIILGFVFRVNAQSIGLLDSTLNNLVHPLGYKTCKIGELGNVVKHGNSKQSMILIPGMGFDGYVFDEFVKRYSKKYAVYVVTPAGFGMTQAAEMPDTSSRYASMPWTNGIVKGIINLIEKENLIEPVIVGHFISGGQAAFALGLDHPELVGKIIIISGSSYRYLPTPLNKEQTSYDWTKELKVRPEQRAIVTEKFIAPKWFKTVTKKTWDSFMWTSSDYCKDTIVGNKLFNEIQQIPMNAIVRYMVEWGAADPRNKFKDIKTKTLFLIPGFKGLVAENGDTSSCTNAAAKQYLTYYIKESWNEAKSCGNPNLKFEYIYDSRIFMWYDQPKKVFKTIDDFLSGK